MFIKMLNDDAFIVFEDVKTYEPDGEISNEIYEVYQINTQQGRCFRIKNLKGSNFEEYFEELEPREDVQKPNEMDLLKKQLADLQFELMMNGVI